MTIYELIKDDTLPEKQFIELRQSSERQYKFKRQQQFFEVYQTDK